MLLFSFAYTFAMVSLVLGLYAIVRYAAPDTLPGRISAALVG